MTAHQQFTRKGDPKKSGKKRGDPKKGSKKKTGGNKKGPGNQANVASVDASTQTKSTDKPLFSDGGQKLTIDTGLWGEAVIKGQDNIQWTSAEEDGKKTVLAGDSKKGTLSHSKVVTDGDQTQTTSNTVSTEGYSRSKSTKDTHDNKSSDAFTVNGDGVAGSRSRVNKEDESSSSSSIQLNTDGGSASHYFEVDNRKTGGSFTADEHGVKSSMMLNNYGLSVQDYDSEKAVSYEMWNGKETWSGGAFHNTETGETGLNFGVSNPKDKSSTKAALTVGDGELSADVAYSTKVAKVEAGFDYVNRDGEYVGDSDLVDGPAAIVDNLSSFGVHGTAQYGIGASGKSSESKQVRVLQAFEQGCPITQAQSDEMRELRDHVTDGGRFDVTRMPVGMGVEQVQGSESGAAALADMAVVGGRFGGEWNTIRSQGIARTESGYVIQDVLDESEGFDASVNAEIWGFGLAGAGGESSSGQRQSLSFELDASDPAAVDYAQDYADLGLLPTWDVACEHQGKPELVGRLRQVLAALRANGAHLNSTRMQSSRLVTEANGYVRSLKLTGEMDDQCGVTNTDAERDDHSAYSSSVSLLGIYMGGFEGQTGDHRARHTDSGGHRYLDASWSQSADGGHQAGRASGALDAPLALSIETVQAKGATDLKLSAESVALLGQQIRTADSSETLWPGLAEDARAYWAAVKAYEEAAIALTGNPRPIAGPALRDRLPPDVFKLWVDAPLPAERLIELLGQVSSAEDFEKLSAPLQATFVQSAVAGRSSGSLEALAAVSLMQDGEARGAALAGVAHSVVDAPEQARAQLQSTKGALSPAAALGLELGAQGVAADVAGLVAGRPAAWASVVDALVPSARTTHDRADLLMEVLKQGRKLGGSGLVQGMISNVGADALAHVLALKSAWREGSRLHVFVNKVLEGHSEQAGLAADWAQIALPHNADVDSRESTGFGYFESRLDSPSLGDAGLSENQLQVMKAKMQDLDGVSFLRTPQEVAAAKKEKQANADIIVSGKIEDALDSGDPAAFIAAVEWYREVAAPFADECLSDWAERHKARIGHRMGTIRQRAVREEVGRIAELTADWDVLEKMGATMELEESNPMRRRFGF